jgi:hypothetical protein
MNNADHPTINEAVTAVNVLRVAAAGGYRLPPHVREAIKILDNAEVFRFADEAAPEGA